MATAEKVRQLPTADELLVIERALMEAHDLIEGVAWAAGVVDKSDTDEYPHPIGFETIGVLASVRAVLDVRIDNFQDFSKRIDSAIFSALAIQEQKNVEAVKS